MTTNQQLTRTWLRNTTALEPSALRRYLRARNWTERSPAEARAHVYAQALDDTSVEVEIPAHTRFADYARRIGEAIEIVAAFEKRDPVEILANLRRPESDVVRFTLDGQETAMGTIGIDDAIRLREARKKMLLAVAHTVLEPLPHFPRLGRADPLDFVASCREGPTRVGSYVSEVLVPVSPAIGELELDDPFSRKVTTRLARALARTERALDSGDDEDLLRGAADGLSSNFLGALASLRPSGGVLEVALDWAGGRKTPSIPTPVTRFAPHVFGALEEAARVLTESVNVPGYELEGFIAHLRRDEKDPGAPGEVVVVASIEERPGTSKVVLELPSESYDLALEAHRKASRIRVVGTLAKQGRRLVLLQPEGLTELPETDT
jgi:hypothetical protein